MVRLFFCVALPPQTGKKRRDDEKGNALRKTLSRKEAQEFRRRWALVNAAEQAELRTTPLERKLRQLATLMAVVQPAGWTDVLKAEDAEVRARWNRLRAALNGRA
jgi:hypothetical protein